MADPLATELSQDADALRAMARVLVGDRHADDLVQDVVLQVLQHPPPDPKGLRAWLVVVLRRRASNHHRTEARRRRRLDEVAARGTEAAGDAAGVAEQQETVRAVTAALFALPDPYREALFRRFFRGETPTAIATATNEPLATVKSRLQRGLSLLRQRLDDERPGTWRAALCAALGLDDAGLVLPSTTAAGGLFVMGFGIKLAAAAAAILATVLFWPRQDDPLPPPHLVAGNAAPAPPAAGRLGDAERRRAEAPPAVPAAEPTRVAVVEGRCVDEFGSPLAAVAVELGNRPGAAERIAAWTRRHDLPPAVPTATATTGADGRFRFEVPAWLPLCFQLRIASTHLVPLEGTFADVEPGSVIALGSVRLVRGTRFFGRLVHRDGSPAAAVDIDLEGFETLDGPVTPITFTTFRTDVDGAFRADEALPAGRYLVRAHRRRNPSPAEVTADARGGEVALDLVVDTVDAPTQLQGMVVDAVGAPIAGAVVQRRLGDNPLFFPWATTDGDGRFTLGRQAGDPEVLALRVVHPAHEPATAECAFGADDVRIELGDGAAIDVAVVEDPTGRPVEDYQLRIVRVEAGTACETRVEHIGHHAGGTTTLRLRRGDYWLFAEPRSHELAVTAPTELVVDDALLRRVVLHAAAEHEALVRVQRADGSAVAGSRAALVDALGRELNAMTPLHRPTGKDWPCYPAAAVLLAEGRTDGNGRVVLPAPDRRDLTLVVDGETHLFTAVAFAPAANGEVVVTVEVGGSLRGELEPATALAHYREFAGPVGSRGGEPDPLRVVIAPEGASLAAAHAVAAVAALTPDGRFEARGLLPGTWTVRLQFAWRHEGSEITLETALGAITVGEGSSEVVRFSLAAEVPGRLRARVLHNGEPARSRQLSIACDVPRPGAEAMAFSIDVRTDGNGELDVPVLPGRYSVVDWGYREERMLCADEIATVGPGQVQTTAFHLWSGTLRLTLRTAAGAPARGMAPRFWNRTAREHYVHDQRTDEHGVVEVELSAGDYEVQLGELGPEGTTIGTVAIRPGERAEAHLSLPR
ncbi:MAG TPA: sigma-70 family RNA polymerase sigma factor [Planctomycetota bacterium]|nr:sigma-70 family RNA polymerase sigma factor [Planctomycetota bacterium]